jgi:hypothetical protein
MRDDPTNKLVLTHWQVSFIRSPGSWLVFSAVASLAYLLSRTLAGPIR